MHFETFLGSKQHFLIFCNFFNLDYEQIIPCWLQSGLKEDFFSTPRGYSKTPAFETFIKKIFSQVICTANQEKDNVIQYLQQIGFHSNVAVVDIGWKGSIQNSLEDERSRKQTEESKKKRKNIVRLIVAGSILMVVIFATVFAVEIYPNHIKKAITYNAAVKYQYDRK